MVKVRNEESRIERVTEGGKSLVRFAGSDVVYLGESG